MVRHKALLALLSLSSACIAQAPASAQLGIEFAKDSIRQNERDRKENPGSYASQVYALAEEYQRNGQFQKAESTFREAIKLYKLDRHADKPQYRASILLSWAQFLAEGTERLTTDEKETHTTGRITERKLNSADYRRINQFALEALQEVNKTEDTNTNKAWSYLSAISLFDKTGNLIEKERCESYILSVAKVYEKEPTVPNDVLIAYADILNRLADTTVHMIQPPLDKPTYQIALDTNEFYTSERFSKAEKIKLAALRLFDKLPKDNQYRIGAHKSLALWYMLFKKDAEAARETKVLSELVGTSDEKVLFPKYLGCGRFEGQKLAQLCGAG